MAENQPQETVASDTPPSIPSVLYSNEEQVQNSVNALCKNVSDYITGELQGTYNTYLQLTVSEQ